jgi:hypothetical protein
MAERERERERERLCVRVTHVKRGWQRGRDLGELIANELIAKFVNQNS